ncbi:MAG: zinc ABC transporter solute-binding protein, partial [Oscillochloris sp.]|nr:zinc ABC transporter solute-binding protein [Oscillochloris sp.]
EQAAPRAVPLNVVATTQQIADTVMNIAGDKVTLKSLLGPGIDPHTYVATEGDIQTFQEADLIFYNGLLLEAQMTRVLEQIGQGGDVRVVAVGDQIDPLTLLNWEPEAGLPYDPHIWNDVRLWIRVAYTIRDTLMELDPTNAALYEANTASYAAELEALHTYTLEQVARIPQERRVLVTAHDAFSYYGRAYGLQVEAVQGISTASEASAADIQALADTIISHQVPAIFVESTISPRTIEAVQAAARAGGQAVSIGGELFSDAMGAADTPEGTYIGMMRHNINTIVAALIR